MTQQENIEKEKFALMFNSVLSMENAACKRLEKRINEVSLPEAKQQLQHHLEETKEQQKRLQDQTVREKKKGMKYSARSKRLSGINVYRRTAHILTKIYAKQIPT